MRLERRESEGINLVEVRIWGDVDEGLKNWKNLAECSGKFGAKNFIPILTYSFLFCSSVYTFCSV